MEAPVRQHVKRTLDLCGLPRGPLKGMSMIEFTMRWLECFSAEHNGMSRLEWTSGHLIDPCTEYEFVVRQAFEIRGRATLERLRFQGRSRFLTVAVLKDSGYQRNGARRAARTPTDSRRSFRLPATARPVCSARRGGLWRRRGRCPRAAILLSHMADS